MMFKAIANGDSGDFSLMERTLPPHGRQPPPHRHTTCSEAYFVLDGEVSVDFDGIKNTLGPRAFALVPRGTAHTFGNRSDVEARLLVIHAPAMDAYFAELHALWHRDNPPSREEEIDLMGASGWNPPDPVQGTPCGSRLGSVTTAIANPSRIRMIKTRHQRG